MLKKFETKYVSETDIVRVALNYLGQIYDNPEHNKKMSWKMEAIQVFDGCCAEAIKILVEKHFYSLYITERGKLTFARLRRNYRSVFDGENKKELEKL